MTETATPLLEEKQHFRQWWLWIFLIGFNITCLYGMYSQLYLGKAFGSKPVSNEGMASLTVLSLLFSYFFASLRLETRFYAHELRFRYFPFLYRWRTIPYADISQAYIRTYRPLFEYGGWGIRITFGKKGMAYNVSGNQGLQLELKTGKRILLGTRQTQALEKILHQLRESGQLPSEHEKNTP